MIREEFELPTRFFKSGENKLVLTAADDPKEGKLNPHEAATLRIRAAKLR